MAQMTPQMKQLDKVINTPQMFDLVNAYLLQRAYAETMRERVDAIWQALLNENETYEEDKPDKRITEPRSAWLTDDATFARLAAEANRRERAAKLKPDEMPDEYCPALVAEEQLNGIERAIIETAGAPLGITTHRLLCQTNGLEKRAQFLDLVIKAVFCLPDFKPTTPQPEESHVTLGALLSEAAYIA